MIGDPAQWQGLTDGSFKGVKFHYSVPSGPAAHGAVSEETQSGRRLQISQRAGVDGGRIRDFGAEPEQYSLDVIFFGPNWQTDFDNFKAVLNQGTAGALVLPTISYSINAFFSKMVEKAQVGDGNAKTIQITWIEDNSADAPDVDVDDYETSKSALTAAIQGVASAVSGNPFLTAVQATNTALSTVRNVVNTVLTLQQGVQNQIKQLQANITGTIALVKQGVESIDSVFGSSANTAATSSVGVGTVDPITGLPYASTANSPAPTSSVLTQPATPSDAVISVQNTSSVAGATAAIDAYVSALLSQRSQLVGLCGARTQDVKSTLTTLINALTVYSTYIQPIAETNILVLQPISLLEILFQSQGSIDGYYDTFRKNPWIDDPLILTVGSVVTI